MKTSNFNQSLSGIFLALLCASSITHAGIYKWVDANGKTHYSESKENAGNAKTEELKVVSQPASAATGSSAQYWQDQDRQFRQRQIQNQNTDTAPASTKPKSLSGGKSDTTDASKCNLARDILSGAVKHSNGAPTDKNDKEIAQNDVRIFCH